jgi:sirohydrochlorin ferrochelatase
MEEATEILVKERKVSSLMYVPYLFFPGIILKRNVLGTMRELQATYPRIPMTVTPPLGADGPAVDVAAQRVRQLWDRAQD